MSSSSQSMEWTSKSSLSTDHSEWILVNLDSVLDLGSVVIYPRSDAGNQGYGFPKDFTIKVSTDSLNWTTVVTKSAYALPGRNAQRFTFRSQAGRFVKIEGTSLHINPFDLNQYRMQFGEIQVNGIDAVTFTTPFRSGSTANPSKSLGAEQVFDLLGRVVDTPSKTVSRRAVALPTR